jgi:hypothetical protein
LGTTWTYLEDHLREQRERIDSLLSDTLRTGELISPEDLYLYYRKVCQFLDMDEGERKVNDLITEDQLDMLLCMLPFEEAVKWKQWRGDGPLEDMSLSLFDFCWQRAANLRTQVLSLERLEEPVPPAAWHAGYPRWFGPCILGDICGSYHMPEVCRMFERMSPEGRLSVIQSKGLCHFCLRHPDTDRCPSQSLPACPVRGCMRMHHKMLHRALLREEARPVVLGEAQHAGGWRPGEELPPSDSEDSALDVSDEGEAEEPAKIRLCMQMVPVEAANGAMRGLHTLYDWGSTVTLVRRESARRLGFRPAQVAQRVVNGLGGAAVVVTGCHYLPLVDVRGKHQVICAFEVEEITTVAETRLPPWAREVFPSVRAHMPWMDTPAGPIELLIGLDNSQWLPVFLEDSKEPEVNMRLMKSSFGHAFIVMGGKGGALYPRDESMRYKGDPTGERLTSAEMAQKVKLERCFGKRSQPGLKGRAPIKGPMPAPGRVVPDYGPVGSGRPPPKETVGLPPPPLRGAAPPPIRMQFTPSAAPPPPSQGWQEQGGSGQGRGMGPQQQGSAFPQPFGMPGWFQPPGQADPVQRLALMMALMVLGMPPVHGCYAPTRCGVSSSADMSEPRICPPVESETRIGLTVPRVEMDEEQWIRLPAIRCMAGQSVLTLTCGLGGRTQRAKYEKFREPCGIQPTACWKALESGKLKVGEMEHPVKINQTRSHMANEEFCDKGCNEPVTALERRIVQVLMEVLVEEDWIWWNKEKNLMATESGRVTSVLRRGEAILEDGLRVWHPGDENSDSAEAGGANLPLDGGGTSTPDKERN